MRDFLQILLVGIGDGAVYAMLGLGLVVIYRSTGVLNFAQGELSMFSTFIVWTPGTQSIPMWLAVLGGMVGGFLVGALIHEVAVRPVGDPHQKPLAVVIVTIGLFPGDRWAAQLIWGTVDRSLNPLFGSGQVTIGGVAIAWQKIGSVVVLGATAFVSPPSCSCPEDEAWIGDALGRIKLRVRRTRGSSRTEAPDARVGTRHWSGDGGRSVHRSKPGFGHESHAADADLRIRRNYARRLSTHWSER